MKIKLIDFKCMLTKGYISDAGWDLSARIDKPIRINSMGRATIPVGVAIELPRKSVGIVKGRSSMGERGVLIMEGVIDEGYRGEIKVTVVNVGTNPVEINPYDRIAQLLILNLCQEGMSLDIVDRLSETPRGCNGFGSTGKK